MKQPKLSICIPTYNRCEYLQKSIKTIVVQPDFQCGNVEIVVADNCSTDHTKEVCEKYTEQYTNFIYYRNQENIHDANFWNVLNKANGVYRKLSNDTLLYHKNSLNKMLEVVQRNMDKKPYIFWDNRKGKSYLTASLDDVIYDVSFNVTWIGTFGLWEDDIKDSVGTVEECESKLWQVSVFFRLFEKHKIVYVSKYSFMDHQSVLKKNLDYGLYKVFYVNFLRYVRAYVGKNLISETCYDWLERDLLYHFFANWMINFDINRENYIISECDLDLKKMLLQNYRGKDYYQSFLRYYNRRLFFRRVFHLIRK